ncbi:MAG: synthase protein [Pseudomonadota bacterium]|nr:synthase protein [Pseudomonadota bacterium]
MNQQVKTKTKLKAWLLWPLVISILISGIVIKTQGFNEAGSFLLGALTIILPQAVFGFYCFRYAGALQSRQIWQSFVKGEVLKILFAVALFAFVFYYLPIVPIWFFLAVILMQFIQLVINCWLLNR